MSLARSALVAALALGLTALAVRIVVGEQSEASTAAPRFVRTAAAADARPPRRPPATTTSTTSTTVPAPPPTLATPARRAAKLSPSAQTVAPPAPAPAPITADSASEARALQLVNGERARAGLPALSTNGGATSVARSWARWMAGHSVAHNSNLARDLDRAGVTGWRTIGENVGSGSDADQVHRMFMASGTHRANILSNQFSAVGVGAVRRGDVVWITLDFVGW